MAEVKNPLTERVKKMAAILEAAKEAGRKVKEEEAKEALAETGRSGQSSE